MLVSCVCWEKINFTGGDGHARFDVKGAEGPCERSLHCLYGMYVSAGTAGVTGRHAVAAMFPF